MNIESILSKIDLFESLIINSGFQRDLNDFIQAIQQPQNQNLVFMKELSLKIQRAYIDFINNSLPSELDLILKDTTAFTSQNFDEQLFNLDSNQTIDGGSYFNQFNGILQNFSSLINQNSSELGSTKRFLLKYASHEKQAESKEHQALVSLVFKDLSSTGTLKEFTTVLARWNRTLLILHQLLKSDSPEDISLVGIQNGSIDVIFNIDIDIAVDFVDLVKIGFQVYGAYLLYKSKAAKEIIATYFGNKELIKSEVKRENLLLDNIKAAVKQKLIELHTNKLLIDTEIDKTSIEVKADQVSSVITEHIIKGNEIKLLTPPKIENGDSNVEVDTKSSNELREVTAIAKERYKNLSPEDKTLLLEKYSIKDSE